MVTVIASVPASVLAAFFGAVAGSGLTGGIALYRDHSQRDVAFRTACHELVEASLSAQVQIKVAIDNKRHPTPAESAFLQEFTSDWRDLRQSVLLRLPRQDCYTLMTLTRIIDMNFRFPPAPGSELTDTNLEALNEMYNGLARIGGILMRHSYRDPLARRIWAFLRPGVHADEPNVRAMKQGLNDASGLDIEKQDL